MLIVLIVIIGLSLLILGHEAGHFIAAKAFGLKVDEFGFGFPPRIAAWKKGDTEYSLNWLPFGGFVKISGERGELTEWDKKQWKGSEDERQEGAPSEAMTQAERKKLFFTQPAWKKSVIILAGVAMNFVLGWLLISIVLMVGVPKTLVIANVESASPAAQAGLAEGDIIKNFSDAQTFVAFVNSHRGQPIQLDILHNGKESNITVTPRTNTAPNEGPIGVGLAEGGAARENPITALWDGLRGAGILSWLTIQAFGNLIVQVFAHASLPQGVVGPVGIFGIAQETGKIGLAYLLQFIGIISINLMVVNLIPFPALDGGRFLLIIIEKLKGSALSEKVEVAINGIGFALLIALMLFLTVRDVRGLL